MAAVGGPDPPGPCRVARVPRRLTATAPVALTLAVVLAACGSTAPSPPANASVVPAATATAASTAGSSSATSPAASSATGAQELRSGPLHAGTYIRTGFRPALVFTVDDGWAVGTATDGFFDVQRDQGTPDVIAVQFARVDGIVGENRATVPAGDVAAVLAAIRKNPGLTVVDESGSKLGGIDGSIVVVENRGTSHAGVMKVAPGLLGIDAGRKLWIGLFDTADGVLAIMVGGSIAQWDKALKAAEPVLGSVFVRVGPGPSPSN
jgi:hypothetical protein